MPTARWFSLVAVFPTNEMMVVGGNIEVIGGNINKTEIASFNQ
jgi:hypothetical protein